MANGAFIISEQSFRGFLMCKAILEALGEENPELGESEEFRLAVLRFLQKRGEENLNVYVQKQLDQAKKEKLL